MKTKTLLFTLILALGFINFASSQNELLSQQISVLKKYDRNYLHRISLPLGGIGTGTVGFGGTGELRDWEIMNVPAKSFSTVTTGNDAPFFSIYTKKKMNLPNQKHF